MDAKGKVVLPAKSFRGAFRAQAEKILRTMGIHACNPLETIPTNGCCKAVEDISDVEKGKLCMACRIFGAPGWKTPLSISEFRLESGKYEIRTQEFVAIDRFTGGGKASAKFNANAIYRPIFNGTIQVNNNLMPEEGLAILAMTLRDLIEGDITFGFGAAKGYGSCTAEVDLWKDEEYRAKVKTSLRKLNDRVGLKTDEGGSHE
jgi:CRISPR/Cas system CSM-associated protein Csm3 (group 7 of RAMP superfamily)